jgi:hypothetical protein
VAQYKQTGLWLLVPFFAAALARKRKSLAHNNKTARWCSRNKGLLGISGPGDGNADAAKAIIRRLAALCF